MSSSSQAGVVVGAIVGVPVTFALEVLGAAGAVWGASEALGLRNDDNGAIWDVAALTVGAFGLVRYLAKYPLETPQKKRHNDSFSGGFWHAVISPHEAIKDAFYEPESESQLLFTELQAS